MVIEPEFYRFYAVIYRMGFFMVFSHKSVLLDEVIESLNIKPDGYYVDGTLGGGGHALEVVKRLEGGKLIGIDQDADAIKAATQRLIDYRNRVIIVRDNYVNIENILKREGIEKVDGIYVDLGVSSYQLDAAERGFTYRFDAPLDMRMDDRNELKASDIVNDYSETELFHVIRDYGEDRFAKNIAKHIVAYRSKKRIETTFELVDIIKSAIPMKIQVTGGHPAKRTFQAIRIELNKELEVLKDSLNVMIELLNPGGRLSVITFHSLEDRIVKQAFKKAESPCICPKNFPVCVCGNKSKGRVITRKAVLPSEKELEENSRAKSAKLKRKKQGIRRAGVQTEYYTEGNVVRKLESAYPQTWEEDSPSKKVRKNREKMLSMNFPYLVVLSAAMVVVLALCANYISVQSRLTSTIKEAQKNESNLEKLKDENDSAENMIATYLDLDHIKDVAMNKLGMVYAKKNQVITYEKTENEYVRQFDEIPR